MRRTSSFSFFLILILMTTPLLANVFVNLADTSAYPGDTLRVPIRVSDLTGLEVYSYQFKLKYDSLVVKAIGVDSAQTLTENWGVTWVNLENPGEIIMGNYGVTPLQNSGVLIAVMFNIIGEINDSTQLICQQFEFNAGQPPATITDGSIKILHPPVYVQFKSNINAAITIHIDGIEKNLPFDTTWSYGSLHTIGTHSPQYQSEDTRFSFQSWSDGGDTVHSIVTISDTILMLNMNEQFLLTINSEYGNARGSGWYGKGTSAIFSVDSLVQQNDSTRFAFNKWHGSGNSSYTGNQRVVNIIMNDPVVETAEWTTQYYLKIESIYGTPIGAGWHDQGDTVVVGIDSLISLVEGTRYVFDSWSGRGEGSYSGDERLATVIMSAPIFERASWQTEHYLLIRSKPDGIVDFKRSGWYKKHHTVTTDTAQQSVTLPEYVYRFDSWMIEGQVIAGNPIQILMDTSYCADALYQIDSVRVTVRTNIGAGTWIYVDEVRYQVPYSKFWAYQSEHTVAVDSVQLAPSLKTRYFFKFWGDHKPQKHTVIADTVLQLTAFLATQHFLFVDTHPSGLINFAVKGWHDQGDTVALPPVPQQVIIGPETYNFKGWHVDKMPIPGNPINVIMDKPHSAIALYTDFYIISGKIKHHTGLPIPNIAVILSGAYQDTFRIVTGNEYYFNFLIQGDYQISPQCEGFRFDPPSREYASLHNSFSNQNFVAIDTVRPVIRLIYPNGGEQLQSTANDTILWEAEDNMGIDSILIELSSDDGNHWQQIAKFSPTDEQFYAWNIPDISSPRCKIQVQAVDFDGNRAYDTSDAPFSINSTLVVENTENEMRPTKFKVQQNYPNPFNSTTVIRFELPEPAPVKLSIFNMMGQQMVTLLDQKLNAGYHQVKWDAKDRYGKPASSGIYFYQVEAAGKVTIKRLVYIR